MADTLVSGTYVYVRDNGLATPTAISLASDAFAAMSYSSSNIDDYLTDRVDIVFKDPGDMPHIPGTTKPAWGYTFPGIRECWINNKIKGISLPPLKTKHTILHEVGGHMGDEDVLDHSKRILLEALMHPDATGVPWGGGPYQNHPDECSADTFPRAFANISAIQNGYYGFRILSADFATYISIYGGAGGPATMTLAADASIGDMNVKLTSVTGLSVGDWIRIDTSTDIEERELTFVGTSGSGGTGVSFTDATTIFHASGTAVREIPPPVDPGGPGARRDNAIGIAGNDYTLQISADSIKATESGSDFNGTMTWTIRVDPTIGDLPFDDTVQWTDVYWTFEGHTLFGGIFMGATRRHGVASTVYYDCRAVSYDAWLDLRSQPAGGTDGWWTTDDRTSSGTPLTSDKDIIQALLFDAAPFLEYDIYVTETNASMPLLGLSDGTLRDQTSRIGEQATTTGDPLPRRILIDFDEFVHYFEGSEGTTAPYTIGDDPGTADLIPDYIEYDTDYTGAVGAVWVNGTGIARWEFFDDDNYSANTIIDRPEVTDEDPLTDAATAYHANEGAPKYAVKFIVEGYHGWHASQTVSFLDEGLGVTTDFEIRSIDITPSPAGNDQITYEISCGAAPWRGLLDIQRKSAIRRDSR